MRGVAGRRMGVAGGAGGLALVAAVLAACAGANGSGEAPGDREDELTATVEARVTDGAVRFGLHVTNSGEAPIELTFPTSQRYDFVVETREGEEVWRWSDGMAFLQAITQATLAPGESWDMEAEWDPSGRSGEYVVTGVLTAREHGVRQRAAFELP